MQSEGVRVPACTVLRISRPCTDADTLSREGSYVWSRLNSKSRKRLWPVILHSTGECCSRIDGVKSVTVNSFLAGLKNKASACFHRRTLATKMVVLLPAQYHTQLWLQPHITCSQKRQCLAHVPPVAHQTVQASSAAAGIDCGDTPANARLKSVTHPYQQYRIAHIACKQQE